MWIRVQITEGLFPSERAVELDTAEGKIQVFVSGSQLDEGRKALKVSLLDEDDRYVLVNLPSLGGGKVAKMPRGEVISAA